MTGVHNKTRRHQLTFDPPPTPHQHKTHHSPEGPIGRGAAPRRGGRRRHGRPHGEGQRRLAPGVVRGGVFLVGIVGMYKSHTRMASLDRPSPNLPATTPLKI